MKIGRNVAILVSTHAALKTGIHGVDTDYVAKTSQSDQDLSDAEIPAAIARDIEVIAAVGAEATARALAIASHSDLASVHHTKFTTTEHDVVARHPLANLVATVCSETEADAKVAAALSAPGLTVKLFQANPATGDFSNQPSSRINDNDPGVVAYAAVINEYAEVDFGMNVYIHQWRQYGTTDNNGTGRWKIEYYDGAWHDWKTAIPARTSADWSAFSVETPVICSKVKLTATTIDTQFNRSGMAELEVVWSYD